MEKFKSLTTLAEWHAYGYVAVTADKFKSL
jgi:hypothetical protein